MLGDCWVGGMFLLKGVGFILKVGVELGKRWLEKVGGWEKVVGSCKRVSGLMGVVVECFL